MGQKINPKGFRLPLLQNWESRWFAQKDKNYQQFLLTDIKLRRALIDKLKIAGIAKVEIERAINRMNIVLSVAKPGMVIGHGGQGMEDLKKFVLQFLKKDNQESLVTIDKKKEDKNYRVDIRVEAIKEPNLNAYLVAVYVADQLAKRMHHKRVVKQAIERVMVAGAKGVRIRLAGRIAGAEISRAEKYQRGNLSLGTLRENIDYAEVPSLTKSGYIGVKVWICKKSILCLHQKE
jgi:small subunit ribosomal protein S3